MKINKIKLSNFRLFDNLEVDLHPNMTVLVGKNGTGKSTVLEAISIAAGTLFSSFSDVAVSSIKKTDAHYKYYDFGGAIDVQPQYPVTVQADGIVNHKSITWKRSLNSGSGKTTIVGAKELDNISKDYQVRLRKGDASLILPVIAYYGTGRLWDQHREKKSDSWRQNTRTNGYIDCLDGTTNMKLMLHWFQKMTISDKQKRDSSPELAAVQNAMERLFTMMTGIDQVKVQYNLDTLEIDVAYMDKSGGQVRIPLNRLSDGYRCALCLIADIAYRAAVLNPQLGKDMLLRTDGIVLIDEVDLHLHPAWQQRILSDLMTIFPQIQFIVSTHAPAVINSVKSDNLVVLENGVVREPNGQVYGKDIASIVKGVMEANARPIQIEQMFQKFYDLIEKKQLSDAEKILNEMEQEIGNDDSEIAGCRMKLKLAKIRSNVHD